MHILEFEKEIVAVENQIREMKSLSHMYDSVGDITHEVGKLKKKLRRLTFEVFGNLNGWQKTQVARHPDRPHTLDYVKSVFTDFVELNGDRHGGLGPCLVGGLARLEGRPVMVMGHEKGRTPEEKIRRNFGMAQPEDYRKSQRLMKLAEKFGLPLITFIDTPGAYPGIAAEEQGQSEAIAANLMLMASLRVPSVAMVIGEGGSGGALAIGVADRILMFEHSVYSVISPEGCASILWDSQDKVEQAAEALGLTAKDLLDLRVIDKIIYEPLGGAHRHRKRAINILKKALRAALDEVLSVPPERLLVQRHAKFRNMGVFGDSLKDDPS
jgi:acetyl-CoA carboxylase carboxyl transferase subunit alpha